MGNYRPGHVLVATMLGVAALVAACTPTTPGGGTTTTTTTDVPTPPSIVSFAVDGGVGPSPSLVALAWNVTDPNGDELTCAIDGDGDGVDDVVVEDCGGTGSRNVALPDAGEYVARLTVADGSFPEVTSSRLVDVPAGSVETMDLQLRGVDALSPEQAAAFVDAEAYWEAAISRGIDDFPTAPRPACLPDDSGDLPPVVDDVIIDVSVAPIDGAGSILGQAGPTCYNTDNELPLHGIMQFDDADVANLLSNGTFDDVILHEMAHVLGIGTLWDMTIYGGVRKVLTGAGGATPRFTGGRGVAEYSTLGADGTIPVENSGGPGTRDAHWREVTFDNELMTGFINAGANPVSRMTVASLADLGYRVDLSAAQAYSLPGGAGALRAPSGEIGGTVLRPTPGAA